MRDDACWFFPKLILLLPYNSCASDHNYNILYFPLPWFHGKCNHLTDKFENKPAVLALLQLSLPSCGVPHPPGTFKRLSWDLPNFAPPRGGHQGSHLVAPHCRHCLPPPATHVPNLAPIGMAEEPPCLFVTLSSMWDPRRGAILLSYNSVKLHAKDNQHMRLEAVPCTCIIVSKTVSWCLRPFFQAIVRVCLRILPTSRRICVGENYKIFPAQTR